MTTRTHFVRFLTKTQIKNCQQMLSKVSGMPHPIDFKAGHFKINAPDGDEVFSGLDTGRGRWICMLHREVFEEEPLATEN